MRGSSVPLNLQGGHTFCGVAAYIAMPMIEKMKVFANRTEKGIKPMENDMSKTEAEALLREKVAALDIKDMALLVKVAGEAINDLSACREIAGIVDMDADALLEWGERVLNSGSHSESLIVLGETAMGWYDGQPA